MDELPLNPESIASEHSVEPSERMTPETAQWGNGISRHFEQFVKQFGGGGPIGRIATALARGELGTESLKWTIDGQGESEEGWFRKGLLDLVLSYIQSSALEGVISDQCRRNIHLLKLCLGIREGEFFSERPAEVAAVLGEQLDYILDDLQIDNAEDLYQVELQAVFDLSYDHYLQLTRSAFERSLTAIRLDLGRAEMRHDKAAASDLYKKAQALEPIALLALNQPRTLGALY